LRNTQCVLFNPLRRFDLDYPIECDDEYWETPDPKDAFKQPPGKPSKITYFVLTLKLAELLGFALRTIYATKKSKTLFGVIGNEWETQVVTELDSSMNKLRDSLPHFREFMRFDAGNNLLILFSSLGPGEPRHYLLCTIHCPLHLFLSSPDASPQTIPDERFGIVIYVARNLQ